MRNIKKIVAIFLIIVGLLFLLNYEIKVLNKFNEEDKIKIYFANRNIKKGEKIYKKDFKVKEILNTNLEDNFMIFSKKIFNIYAKVDIKENSIILKEMISEKQVKKIPYGKIEFALELLGENSNAWNVKKGEYVSLLVKPKNTNIDQKDCKRRFKIYKNLLVYKILNENFNEISNKNNDEFSSPKYIIFLLKKEDAINIILDKESSIITLSKEWKCSNFFKFTNIDKKAK